MLSVDKLVLNVGIYNPTTGFTRSSGIPHSYMLKTHQGWNVRPPLILSYDCKELLGIISLLSEAGWGFITPVFLPLKCPEGPPGSLWPTGASAAQEAFHAAPALLNRLGMTGIPMRAQGSKMHFNGRVNDGAQTDKRTFQGSHNSPLWWQTWPLALQTALSLPLTSSKQAKLDEGRIISCVGPPHMKLGLLTQQKPPGPPVPVINPPTWKTARWLNPCHPKDCGCFLHVSCFLSLVKIQYCKFLI